MQVNLNFMKMFGTMNTRINISVALFILFIFGCFYLIDLHIYWERHINPITTKDIMEYHEALDCPSSEHRIEYFYAVRFDAVDSAASWPNVIRTINNKDTLLVSHTCNF